MTRRFGNDVSESNLPGSISVVPAVFPGVSLPADRSAVQIVPLCVPTDPVGQEPLEEVEVGGTTAGTLVGGAVSVSDVSSVTCQDELDIPLSKLVSLSQRRHEGESDSPVVDERAASEEALVGVTVVSGGQKTASPRFSSFLPNFKVGFDGQTTSAGLGRD